jgi:iron complex outermembrane recepter protein
VVLKRNLLTLALASALFSVAAYAAEDDKMQAKTDAEAAADDADAAKEDADALDAVVVTGIRRGIETAISVKQNQTSIVEVISAEDIGKLPDTSIAESIARLPGLTAQRVAGRPSTISIRGLSGDFSTTLLNGREQVSSGDNRGVEFDQYPSELLSSVLIYKTPDASLVATGISGTVDLRTIRPLESTGRVVALNARFEKNSLGALNPGSDDKGGRFSFSYVDKFADDTIGVAVGFARLDSPGQANKWDGWGYGDVNGSAPGFIAGLNGGSAYAISTDNVRNGLMGVVEFAPNDFYNGAIDLYYSKFERDETQRGIQAGFGGTASNIVIRDNYATSARIAGAYGPVIRNDLNTREDDIFAFGFKNIFSISDQWKATADFSLSRANRDESILETYSGIQNNADTVTININPANGIPNFSWGLNYADPNVIKLTDPGGWGQNGYVKFPKFKDELRSVLVSGERTFDEGAFRSLDLGVNYSHRTKSREVAESFLDLITRPATAIPSSILRGTANLSFTGNRVVAYDVQQAFNTLYRPRTNVNQDILNKDWEVKETVINGFAKLNMDTTIGEFPLTGNVGVQYVRADQESSGFAVPGGNANVAKPFKGGAKYGDVLPSLNLNAELADRMFLRFGAAKTVARPRLDQMRANNGFGIDVARNRYSGGGGNPELQPWKATGFDLSFEKYFGTRGYVSAAVFHKNLSSYIYDQTVPFDFAGFDVSSFTGVKPATTVGVFTRPTNGEGGGINGLELAFSVPFDLLWEPLDGFGMQGSYSDTRSSIKPNGPGTSQALPGLSRYVSNMTFYYEKYGFSARVSRRLRSNFIGEIQGFGADRDTKFIGAEQIVDLQTGYEFQDYGLKGLSLLLQVNNLTNESYRELAQVPDGRLLPQQTSIYGRTVLFGANYKF